MKEGEGEGKERKMERFSFLKDHVTTGSSGRFLEGGRE